MKKLLSPIIAGVRDAGRAILGIYNSEFSVSYKADSSPLTEADRQSHDILLRVLRDISPDIPVCSEEGEVIPYAERKNWNEFYLVDPLDGTKEFVKRNGEFTVNVGFIRKGIPVLGVIYAPVTDTFYYASEGEGSWKQTGTVSPEKIRVATAPRAAGLIVAASRSHGSPELETFLAKLQIGERISAGSSLKFCLVAEGKADLYPRFGPTWEWDTAAGHAILLEAGGRVTATDGSAELSYNKETLKHEGFIARPSGIAYAR
ncbi:MAG: 3'(2'),5'-bisphosphate nucleotidase CysQ [Thermodesulfovibrionales bacterium]